jgi:hypothetical protein
MGTYSIVLAGTSNYQDAIGKSQKGQRVDLIPEQFNKHDKQAVRAVTEHGRIIGYLPKDSWLKRLIFDEGKATHGRLMDVTGGTVGKPTMGVLLEVVTGHDAELMHEREGR